LQTDFIRYTLSNGLVVLLKELHTAPLISHWIWYRVGSRDEPPGLTGASHWVEHMQFKGTPKFPAGMLDKAISRDGGYWNAFTYLDWTAYFETLPADKIDLALSLEADRMLNSAFEPEEVESERSVIISERQGDENEPTFRLAEKIQNSAFQVHPYRHEIIGEMADLESIQRDDLYRHYQTYYVPNNAVLSIAGDFTIDEMLSKVRQYYESIPIGVEAPRISLHEEPQEHEQRVMVEGEGETIYLEISYHVPPANHPDFLVLEILDCLLSGASNLSIFGGGLSNKTSRLYRALVEKELAASVYGGLQATIDPYLYSISAIVLPQREVESVVQVIDSEIQQIQETPPLPEELARAVKQARALFAYNSESITNQASWTGLVEMFADQHWLTGYLDRLAEITPTEVQRVAQQYLNPQNRVLGVYKPS
jgi:zinc protease